MDLRTVALVGGLVVTLGAALSERLQPSQSGAGQAGPRTSDVRPLGVSGPAGPLTEQLRLKLQQKPAAPRPDRNPFVFSARRTAPPPIRRSTPSATALVDEAPAPLPPDPPAPGAGLRLTGMASTQGPDGPVWTAMVHDGQGLLYVQRGDALPGGFQVVEVDETWITLRDAAGAERTLRLR